MVHSHTVHLPLGALLTWCTVWVAQVESWTYSGSSVLWVLLDGEIAAACQLSDEMRAETPPAMQACLLPPCRTTMLTFQIRHP